MANLAAVIPEPRARIVVSPAETHEPGPHELLVRNELIALNPVEAKLAKYAFLPLQYPATIGSSFGGTVVAVGDLVIGFNIGDRVSVFKSGSNGHRYGAYQRFVLARDTTISKVPKNIDLSIPVSLISSLGVVVGLFSGKLGMDRPDVSGTESCSSKKVLIYGGTSNIGSLAVQYVAQTGRAVITTTSPIHRGFVSELGAAQVVDHRQDWKAVVDALVAYGPYDIVVDAISLPSTVKITGEVLARQGGGTLYALLPAQGPESLPKGVTPEFASWSSLLEEETHTDLQHWAFHTYLPEALSSGRLHSLPTRKITGGLEGLNEALEILNKGASGEKLVVNPWDTLATNPIP